MDSATLLADPTAIRLKKIVSDIGSLILVVQAAQPQAECPRCHRPSTRVHSYCSLAAPMSAATAEGNEAYAGCRLRLRPHLERVKRVRRQ
jgi:hypothetical protein